MLLDYLRRISRIVVRDPLYAPRVLGALLRHPVEGRERVAERLGEWRAAREPVPAYRSRPDWEAELHRRLRAAWPCPVREEFPALWYDIGRGLRDRGLEVGRGSFGGWDDADPALARLVWCATRHLAPETVVETGVARGITTRCILEALERNGRGRLWSIDLPPLIGAHYRAQVGAAVPERLRHRWTYIEGSSRTRLSSLLRKLGRIQLFVHDSMHTDRNLGFELAQVWPALAPGGVVVADDIERNAAFARFAASRAAGCTSILGVADDGVANIGIAIGSIP
jgi:predicted O-methyltransferase YrrM